MMRIITGTARGAKLQAPAGETTRPTAERTKEAVFSMLQYTFAERTVLDLFGGSGQMGLEAVSRGAAMAVLVDRDRGALDAMKKNAAHTRLQDRVQIVLGDALSFLKTHQGAPFHLIFLDPPYDAGLIPQCLSLILSCNILAKGGIVVCETKEPDEIFGGDEHLAAFFTVLRRARYGVAHIALLTLAAPAE